MVLKMHMYLVDDVYFGPASATNNTHLLVDSETGVVYYETRGMMFPRYDSDGKIMVLPKSQLRGQIESAAKSYAESHKWKPEFESI